MQNVSSVFSTNWWTDNVALYGSTTVSETCNGYHNLAHSMFIKMLAFMLKEYMLVFFLPWEMELRWMCSTHPVIEKKEQIQHIRMAIENFSNSQIRISPLFYQGILLES